MKITEKNQLSRLLHEEQILKEEISDLEEKRNFHRRKGHNLTKNALRAKKIALEAVLKTKDDLLKKMIK